MLGFQTVAQVIGFERFSIGVFLSESAAKYLIPLNFLYNFR